MTGVPCFIYHGFYERPAELSALPVSEKRYFLSAAQFEHHLDYLAEQGFQGCSVADYLAAPDLPDVKRVIITFDDGHLSNYTLAWPMLRARGFRGTFFIVADWVGQPDRMNRDHLKELVRSGMSVGSHGLTHARMGGLSVPDLDRELVQSREALEQMLGVPIRHLAFPGGVHDSRVIRRAKRAGYDCVCTSVPGLATPGLVINRFSVINVTDISTISALANRDKTHVLRRRFGYELIRGVKGIIGAKAYEKVCAPILGSAVLSKHGRGKSRRGKTGT